MPVIWSSHAILERIEADGIGLRRHRIENTSSMTVVAVQMKGHIGPLFFPVENFHLIEFI